jgi:hypothetical protein
MKCEGAYAELDVESCSSCTATYGRPAAARCAEANGPCPLFDGAECRRPCSRPGPSCCICSGGTGNDSCAGCDEMVGKSSQLKSRISVWSRLLSSLVPFSGLFGSASSVACVCGVDDRDFTVLGFLGLLSNRPGGRPIFLAALGVRFTSKGRVSSCHVRALQMSRTVFSLTSNARATDVAVGLFSLEEWVKERRNISIAWSLVSTVLGFLQA